MSTHGHTTIRNPTSRPALAMDRGRGLVLIVTLLAGLFMTAAGLAALLAPAGSPTPASPDTPTSCMTPAPSSSTSGPACCSRWHWSRGWAQLRWVVGEVTPAASPVLVRFVHQKTALVTTYRQDGRPVSTPVSLAVDGDHAYLRSFEQAGKTRRLHHNPRVDVAPSTARDQPTGPTLQATARRLEDVEAQRAARLLARKHPVLHGLLVPLSHRLGRAKAGKTVHFQLTPLDHGQAR
jgi:PPOX class probable F420-dependent enzyme